MVNKETYFNDLPEHFKHKILNIRNLGNMKIESVSMMPIEEIEDLSVPSCKDLYDIGLELVNSLKDLKPTNVEENLRNELKIFKDYVSIYTNSLNEKNFIGEMDKVIQLLEDRYEKLKR